MNEDNQRLRRQSAIAFGCIISFSLVVAAGALIDNLRTKDTGSVTATAPITNEATNLASMSAGDPIFGVYASFRPSYKVVKVERSADLLASHSNMRITVSKGLSRSDLEQSLRHAAKSEYENKHPNAVVVFGYVAGTNTNSVYTAGKCVFAPYGDVARADEKVGVEQYQVKVELVEDYFKTEKQKYNALYGRTSGKNTISGAVKLADSMVDKEKQADEYVRRRFTEAQRRQIATKIAQAEDRAAHEAQGPLPAPGEDPDGNALQKQEKLQVDLEEKYHNAIRRQYNLTEEQMEAITREATVIKHWE